MRLLLLVTVLALFAPACAETLDDPTPYLTTPRVLAVVMEPAEAKPTAAVRFTALYADANGALTSGPLDYAYCLLQKPLAELGPVAQGCYDPTSTSLVAIPATPPLASPTLPPTNLQAEGPIPLDACRLFGPSAPPPMGDQPGGRPVDPDATGGFFQPVIVSATDGSSSPTLVQVRVDCGLANVTPEVAQEYAAVYLPNHNPSIASLSLVRGSDSTVVPLDGSGSGAPPTVAPNETVSFVVSWPACPEVPVCGDGLCTGNETAASCPVDCVGLAPTRCGAETYPLYQAVEEKIVTNREALSVTYYANNGIFADARTGIDGADSATSTSNDWTAPSVAGDTYVAIVLRDERGGLTFGSYRIRVQP